MRHKMKPRLFILSFSELARDGRVLRQVRSLEPHFEITVAALGEEPGAQLAGVPYRFVRLERRRRLPEKVLRMLSYLPGAVLPALDVWPWSITSEYRMARAALFAEKFDLMLCNDLNAVLLGVEGLRRKGIPFVADYHEFPGSEATERLSYRIFKGPHAARCLRRYGKLAAATLTVNQPFADEFQKRHGIPATVVFNAPELRPLPEVTRPPGDCLRIVHHGMGAPNRNIDVMIEAAGLVKRDMVLHLMLVADDIWMAEMRAMADRLAPGRVVFEKPVNPEQIVEAICRFDVGVTIPQPHSFNNECALPNKLFEYIHAGLAVIYSRAPALVSFAAEHGNGWVAQAVTGPALAEVMESITPEHLAEKKQASLKVRGEIHAGTETAHMVALLQEAYARHRHPAASPVS